MPGVSVLMPVHNAATYVGAAIDSILAQTFRDFELVIVDDGSTDRSRDIVTSFRDSRIKLIPLDRNAGVSGALNAGLAVATSDLIARQDADDLSEPTRLEQQFATLHANTRLALLGSRATAISPNGTATGAVWRPLEENSIRWYALFDNPFIHSTVMFRKAAVDDQGGYRAGRQPFPEDWDLWCRVMEHSAARNLAERLVRYRVTEASVMGGVDTTARVEGYRERWERAVGKIIQDQATRYSDIVTPGDVELMPSFLLGVDGRRLEEFLESFERLLDKFCGTHPNALASGDFRETLAGQYDAIALRVRPGTRRSALQVYAHALRRHPATARHLPWLRAVGLVVFGHQGRSSVAAWRQTRSGSTQP